MATGDISAVLRIQRNSLSVCFDAFSSAKTGPASLEYALPPDHLDLVRQARYGDIVDGGEIRPVEAPGRRGCHRDAAHRKQAGERRLWLPASFERARAGSPCSPGYDEDRALRPPSRRRRAGSRLNKPIGSSSTPVRDRHAGPEASVAGSPPTIVIITIRDELIGFSMRARSRAPCRAARSGSSSAARSRSAHRRPGAPGARP